MSLEGKLPRDSAGRLSAFAAAKSVGLLHHPRMAEVGLQARLVDGKTNQPTGETILVQMQRGDAWAFAQNVLAVAKEQGWSFAFGSEPFDGPGHPGAVN